MTASRARTVSLRARSWLVLSLVAVALTGSTLVLQAYLLEGLDSWFLSAGHAEGASDDTFRSVALGMAPRDVVSLLGPPREKSVLREGRETWWWNRSPAPRSNRVKAVMFDGGRVVEILSELYPD
jgi:hypothetical protein